MIRASMMCMLLTSVATLAACKGCGHVSLPSHWQHERRQGIDSRVGIFKSTEKDFVIHYDIGRMAGNYARDDQDAQWARLDRRYGTTFEYSMGFDGTLYVTFADEGPANFYAKVSNEDDMFYVIELVARFREELLAL